jgi:hypothetical protein
MSTPAPPSPPTPVPNITTVSPLFSTPAPTGVQSESVNVWVVLVGVIVLLILFLASFYYVVLWPKHQLIRYRQKFEELVKTHRTQGDELQIQHALREMGTGRRGDSQSPGGHRKVATFKEIEQARLEREQALLAAQQGGVEIDI